MPSTPANTIQRQRVNTALEAALASHNLVVLTAPMGHGKTTAAEQLLWSWKTRSLYLRFKPGWPDNADFLWHEACTRLEKQGMPQAGALNLAGFPNDDARLYKCLAVFREYLSEAPTLLVLDDFHQTDGTPLHRFFESLIYEEISGFNLLILSRTRPDMPLAYMQAKGYAALLDSTLLDFSQTEARLMFDVAGGQGSEAADTAWGFSNGWAAALRICLQSYQADQVIKPVRNIEDLLTETFSATYSREDQCLLLQLSVMESFSKEQAAYVSGSKDAPQRLKRLYEQNAFIQYSPIPDKYLIHALLRSFLLQRLADGDTQSCENLDIRLLYRRAAECGLDSGDELQAMRLFSQAGENEDLLRILQMFEKPDEGFFMLSAPETVLGIIEGIPWEIRLLSPVGYLGFIHRYTVRVSREAGSRMAEQAESHFLAEGALPEETRRKVRGELALIRAVLSFNDFEAMGRCYAEAYDLLGGTSSLVNRAMFWTFNCPHSAFLYLKKPGGYVELEKTAAEKLVYFQSVSRGSNAGAIELTAAERLLETGNIHKMEQPLQTARYKALEGDQYSAILAVNFTLARRSLAEGRTEGVYEMFELLQKPVKQRSQPALLHNLEVCLGYIASVRNDAERIPAWLLQHEPLRVLNNQAHAFSLIVRGKAIMTLKNWPRLQAFAEKIEPDMETLGSLFGRLHVNLFLAVAAANMHVNNASLGEKYLLRALELAKPDGIFTSIAEYGSHLYPLLQRFNNLHPERRNLTPLLRLTKKYVNLGKQHSSLKLTLRETDIMEMARQGANNKDIGEKLGITQGSVANNMSRIYMKLGVDSRIEAINKWAEESALRAGDKSTD